MKNKKRGYGWIVIEVDLGKAYDRPKWNFVVDTLRDIGFPYHFVNMVYWCISTPNMQVLWDGEVLDKFQPSRRIRHILCRPFTCLFHFAKKLINTVEILSGGYYKCKKIPLVKLDFVCFPKRDGELGLRKVGLMNQALLMKVRGVHMHETK